MKSYAILKGSESGVRVADEGTGETVSIAGRRLDNMSAGAAEEAIRTLERLEAAREQHAAGELARNDLLAILERRSDDEH